MSQFEFTAFAEADLVDGHLGKGVTFVQPTEVPLSFSVNDDDRVLSGDIFDRARDHTGQTAEIVRAGEETGNGGQIYAERGFYASGSDGVRYILVEIEQEGSHENYYTYFGDVPDAGVELTVGRAFNIRTGASYDQLGAGSSAPNIVDIAAGSDDFNLLVRALSTAGLVETVQGLDDITVFAPTDAAFTQLAVDLGFEGDTSDEDAVFDAIVAGLTELGGGDPIPLLTDVLLYHVSAGAKTAEAIDAAETVSTLLDGATFGSEGTELIDNEPDIDNPQIVIPDIQAANGTIQAIDRVLLPVDIPGNTPDTPPEPDAPTLAGIVAASGGEFDADGTDFDLLLNAVEAAGLAGALDDPDADLTVFAPNDAAFVGLAQALGFEGTDEGAAFGYIVDALTLLSGGGDPIPLLKDILLYHVVPEALDSDAVLSAEGIPTLLGASLGVDGLSLVDADPDVADPSLIATDIAASNGIAHVIDGVLLPVDVLQSDGSNSVDFVIGTDEADHISTRKDADFVSGKGGDDDIFLGRGNDVGLGGDGNDQINGQKGDDRISGDAGDDRLNGGRGNDTLDGGDGADILRGGRDADTLTGGADADIFIFNSSSGADTITDFTSGEDLISLHALSVESFEALGEGLSDSDDGAVISVEGIEITLSGVTAGSLTADDFIFG
ncbi:fasciclin domain-containing protein [Litoreibacter roseus]|nr:fasciclin domain-containing protein [Litoreibacter roseus]